MLTMAIWWLAIALEAVLLVRGLQANLIRRFPIFYSYIFFVLAQEIVRFIVYRRYSALYPQVYWITQFVSLLTGSAVIFEIYRLGLRQFPGTARMARSLLLIVFGAVFAKTLLNSSGGVFLWLQGTSLELERNLRIVQALAILTLVSLFVWYAIPFGKNLRGVLIGYGLFVGMSITQFTLWYYSLTRIVDFWRYAQPVCYVLVLCLWTGTLWVRDGVPETQPAMQLENDYQMLAASTRSQLQRTLARLGWAVRS